MTSPATDRRSASHEHGLTSALVLVAFIAISAAVATFGTLATRDQVMGWYQSAEQPPWTPPDWVFGPVWTALYLAMSVAAWFVWRERHERDVRVPLALYVAQLVLNCLWTPLFFALYPIIGEPALWIALADILVLDVLVAVTMIAFWRVSRLAGALFIPYLAWVLYATTLNLGVALLN